MHDNFHLHGRTIDLIDRIHDLSAGCDPDFDAELDDLEREFAELRLRFGNRE
ncbi:hypothetical protein AB1L88_16760 [Tautonia sp. JC769]|uniref:hypothetical protein n=1 Tax=Tautonia sp. JC769 TaxID=3232135 RepID=UPI0034588AED